MSPPLSPDPPLRAAPTFYVTPRQRFSLGSIILAVVVAFGCIPVVLYAFTHSRRGVASTFGAGGSGHGGAGFGAGDDDDDDDPSRVDTIYLGGPDQAPTATRPASHPSTVHPFVVSTLR